MNILITGSSGFIGGNLVSLLRGDHEVRGYDTKEHRDILSPRKLSWALQGCDAVVHLAALPGIPASLLDPVETFEVNVRGTLNVLEGAREMGVRRVLFASSAAPPVTPYGAYKAAGEAMCQAYCRSYGMETVCLRFTNVYGPGSHEKTSVVAEFCRAILSGDPVRIHGDGEQTRDFVYVEDICRGLERVLEAPGESISGKTFSLGSGVISTVNTVLRRLEDTHGEPIHRERLPGRGEARVGPTDLKPSWKAFKYHPVISLEEGLRRTYDYFKALM